jgi:hypothetical protein
MATESQINANRRNAEKSTGPRTTEGLFTSSRNAVTIGFYTQTDFVQPGEEEIYHLFVTNMHQSFEAVDMVEEHLAAEITSAAWRMRRCNLVDGDIATHSTIDPLLDLTQEKQIRSVERARAQATSIFHRSLNQIRKLQKERKSQEKPAPMIPTQQQKETDFLDNLGTQIQSIMHCEEPDWDEIDRQIAEKKAKAKAEQAKEAELASNCKSAEPAPEPTPEELASICNPAPASAPTPARTRLCPCKSGKKYKHCCAKKAA